MFRATALAGLASLLWISTAFAVAGPRSEERVRPVVATAAQGTFPWLLDGLTEWEQEMLLCASYRASNTPKILLLNYSAYDSAYAGKVYAILARLLPKAELTVFWKGSPQELAAQLGQHHVVVVPYPANDRERLARAYGKVLRQYVLRGGAVVFCGTDKFGILQQYNLFDLDFGYFCHEVNVHEDDKAHPIFRDTPEDFVPINYVYPLDISDQAYVSLASVRGYSTIGYKPLGAGKVLYVGIEYYYDEPVTSQILANSVCWLCPASACSFSAPEEMGQLCENETNISTVARPVRRVEEQLYAGTGALANAVEIKIYPNPYLEKAFVEFALDKATPAAIEMTSESGTRVAVLLPYRSLNAGQYRVELPNVSPGVYFVKCQLGGQTVTRRVVKARA